MSINPNIKSKWSGSNQPKTVDYYYNGIISGDRYILSEAISLIESKVTRHTDVSYELLNRCYQVDNPTFRIGITGSPGVGKSSFIEALGLHIIHEKQQKIAVLAIDPSSTKTNGSILGDKTRMQDLGNHIDAFIRPSPSENFLGGISSATKEIICLCEAAGYDKIFIETVGVGQSETMVADMVDLFVLLLLPGAGDEIQGIKRGIVEMADMIIVNKSDGDRVQLSKTIQQNYKNAVHLFQAKEHQQIVNVLRCSSLDKNGISEVYSAMSNFQSSVEESNYLTKTRKTQDQQWFDKSVVFTMERILLSDQSYKEKLDQLRSEINSKSISPYEASKQFSKQLFKTK